MDHQEEEQQGDNNRRQGAHEPCEQMTWCFFYIKMKPGKFLKWKYGFETISTHESPLMICGALGLLGRRFKS